MEPRMADTELRVIPLKEMAKYDAALREFAREIIKSYCWDHYDVDGGDVQDIAVRLGLLVEGVATEDEADADVAPGDTIFRFAEWLR
jgi:hypothetical protein